MHGGASPNHGAAAAKAMASQLASVFAGDAPEVSAGDWLIGEMRRTAAIVAFYGDIASKLAVGQLVWGDAEKILREGGQDAAVEITQRAGPNVWVTMLAAERKHGLDVARTICGLNIDQRRLQLEELKAGAYLWAFDALLDRLHLSAEQRQIAALELPRVLVLAAEQYERGETLG